MSAFNPGLPGTDEYAPPYANYVKLATEGDIVTALSTQLDEALALLRGLSETIANTRHAPYAWSIKQVIGHLTDAERVFSYRALRFARSDATPLPSFEENQYVANANFEASPLSELLNEFEYLRRADVSFFKQLKPEAWSRSGVASNNPITVRAIAYVILGHTRHHLNIVRNRLAGTK
jgi:hypothetical protein